jgi:hypothetical protein
MDRDKLESLLRDTNKTLKRLERVKERLKEEKENEDVWLGHEGTSYKTDWEDYSVLTEHLKVIEDEIKKLEENQGR